MEPISKKEVTSGLRRLMINPVSRIEDIFKKRTLKRRKKELQMQLAIYSGGIKRMK